MKLGCSSWSYHRMFEAGALDQPGWLHKCAVELELDGVELLDQHFPRTDLGYLREIKALALDLGLTISAVSVSNNFGWRSAERRAAEVERVRQWIDIAHFLGASLLRVFAGWPEGDREQAWPAMVACVREALVHAEARGVALAVENHNHHSFVQTADDILRLLDEVRSPWLRFLLDTGNFVDLYDSIERTANRAVFVHAKLYQVDPERGEQKLDYSRIMAALRAAGYWAICPSSTRVKLMRGRRWPRRCVICAGSWRRLSDDHLADRVFVIL